MVRWSLFTWFYVSLQWQCIFHAILLGVLAFLLLLLSSYNQKLCFSWTPVVVLLTIESVGGGREGVGDEFDGINHFCFMLPETITLTSTCFYYLIHPTRKRYPLWLYPLYWLRCMLLLLHWRHLINFHFPEDGANYYVSPTYLWARMIPLKRLYLLMSPYYNVVISWRKFTWAEKKWQKQISLLSSVSTSTRSSVKATADDDGSFSTSHNFGLHIKLFESSSFFDSPNFLSVVLSSACHNNYNLNLKSRITRFAELT